MEVPCSLAEAFRGTKEFILCTPADKADPLIGIASGLNNQYWTTLSYFSSRRRVWLWQKRKHRVTEPSHDSPKYRVPTLYLYTDKAAVLAPRRLRPRLRAPITIAYQSANSRVMEEGNAPPILRCRPQSLWVPDRRPGFWDENYSRTGSSRGLLRPPPRTSFHGK